jgi:hypothetical protein
VLGTGYGSVRPHLRLRYEQMIVMQHTLDELPSVYTGALQRSPYLASKGRIEENPAPRLRQQPICGRAQFAD